MANQIELMLASVTGVATVNVATELVTLPDELVTTTLYAPLLTDEAPRIWNVGCP